MRSHNDISSTPRKYSRWARWSLGRRLKPRFTVLVSGLLIVGFVFLLVIWDRENIFSLDVSTEIAAFTITDPVLAEWTVDSAQLLENPLADSDAARTLDAHATLIIQPGTKVRLQRHGTGPVHVQLTTDRDKSVGRIEQGEGDGIELGNWALLVMKVADRPLVFPFRGTLAAGDDVGVGVNSILLGGTVEVVEEQLLGQTHYIAGEEALKPGDRVQLWRKPSARFPTRRPANVSGFVRAEAMKGFSEPLNAFTLVAHGQADYVQVERLGSAGYHIRAPHWARFLHDPLLAASTAIVALLALLFELLAKFGSLVERESSGRGDSTKVPRDEREPPAEKPATTPSPEANNKQAANTQAQETK